MNKTETTTVSSDMDNMNVYNNMGGNSYGMGSGLGFPRTPTPTPTPKSVELGSPLPLNETCERFLYMGTIVSDAAPYLFPVVIEYSLIAAAVCFIIWRNIGRNVPAKG